MDSLGKNETNCAENLKIAYENKNALGEAKYLEEMGHIYLEKGKTNHDGMDYVKSVALYNAALARYKVPHAKKDKHPETTDTTDKVNNRKSIKRLNSYIVEAEKVYIDKELNNFQDLQQQIFKNTIERKLNLERFRKKCLLQLEEIIENFPAYKEDVNSEKKLALEKKRSEAIRGLYGKISEEMKETVKEIFTKCVRETGKMPCEYALVALGSLATDTMTPYSDLELAILLEEGKDSEENKQYFRKVVYLMYIRMVNYGETILPTVQIESLAKPENEYESWFEDFITPRGFSFDGQVPWASKTPLGRKATANKPSVELIRTPKSMAQLHYQQVTQQKVGYNLNYALLNVACIAGKEKLVTYYRCEVKKILDNLLPVNTDKENMTGIFPGLQTIRNILVFNRLADILQKFEPGNPFNGKVNFDVKREIYRLPSMITTVFSLLYDIPENNPWKILEDMNNKDVIQKNNMVHIQTIVSIAAEMRLKTYLFYRKQKEEMSGLQQMPEFLKNEESTSRIESVSMMARFYATIIPLKTSLQEYFSKISQNFEQDYFIIKEELCVNEYTLKLQFSQNFLEHRGTINIIENEMKNKTPYILVSLNSLAKAFRSLGNYEKAEFYYKQALQWSRKIHGENIVHEDLLTPLFGLANVYSELGNYEKVIKYNERALQISREIYGRNSWHPDIACCLNNLGNAYLNSGRYEEVVTYQQQALRMRKIIFGENGVHPDIIASLGNLANGYYHLGKYEQAVIYHEQALEMGRQFYGKNSAHPTIAASLVNLAITLNRMGNFEKSKEYGKQALLMKEKIYHNEENHLELALSLNNMGYEYNNSRQFEEAAIYLEQALQMQKKILGENSSHPNIASSLNNLGNSFHGLRKFEKAIKLHEQALVIFRQNSGNDRANPNIANTLSDLAEAYISVKIFDKALEYNKQALDMRRKIYGEHKAHFDIGISLFNTSVVFLELNDLDQCFHYMKKAVIMFNKLYEHSIEKHPNAVKAIAELFLVMRKIFRQECYNNKLYLKFMLDILKPK